MQQHELEARYRALTRLFTIQRMRVERREDMAGSQIGVIVNSDVTLWGKLPDDPAQDEQFVLDLSARARAEAKRQD